ncbi:MAG: hypothetical protein V1776_00465 [Candidatus Diapherotrites archaeon]
MPRRRATPRPTLRFLQGLNTQQLLIRGRVHVKHVFDPLELENKAGRNLLYQKIKHGNRIEYRRMTQDQINLWNYRISRWSEERDGTEYHPSKIPFTVYEFRQEKMRPLKSNYYYHEIQGRLARRGKAAIMRLEEMIAEKEREYRKRASKRPITGKKTTRPIELIRHNQKILELYVTLDEAMKYQLRQLDLLKKWAQTNPNTPPTEREKQVAEIDAIMKIKKTNKEYAEKEIRRAQTRIEKINLFPKAPAEARDYMKQLLKELLTTVEKKERTETEWSFLRGTREGAPVAVEIKRGKAQLEYWLALNTLFTEGAIAANLYGTTLSKIELDDILGELSNCKERIHYFRGYISRFQA